MLYKLTQKKAIFLILSEVGVVKWSYYVISHTEK